MRSHTACSLSNSRKPRSAARRRILHQIAAPHLCEPTRASVVYSGSTSAPLRQPQHSTFVIREPIISRPIVSQVLNLFVWGHERKDLPRLVSRILLTASRAMYSEQEGPPSRVVICRMWELPRRGRGERGWPWASCGEGGLAYCASDINGDVFGVRDGSTASQHTKQ